MAEHQNNGLGARIATLFNQIEVDQQQVEAAKEQVQQAEDALAKTKANLAKELKDFGVYDLIAPAQTELSTAAPGRTVKTGAERKPRTSSADKASEVERNKAIYTGSYPLGINEKTGLPIRYKGRGQANDAINAQMADDLRDYAAKNSGGEPTAAQEPEVPAAKATKKK